jgi:hypothetical protein
MRTSNPAIISFLILSLHCYRMNWTLYSFTHSWSWALLEKLRTVQLLKNFPVFYGTRRFSTVFTRALHWTLSWTRSIQSITSHPISLKIHFNIVHPPTSWTLYYMRKKSVMCFLHETQYENNWTEKTTDFISSYSCNQQSQILRLIKPLTQGRWFIFAVGPKWQPWQEIEQHRGSPGIKSVKDVKEIR